MGWPPSGLGRYDTSRAILLITYAIPQVALSYSLSTTYHNAR